eukprot:SAG31_NODE_1844_length_7106_cov_3.064935_2_plen_127_part_00
MNESGRRIKVDFYAAQDWEARKLGPFADGAVFGEQFDHLGAIRFIVRLDRRLCEFCLASSTEHALRAAAAFRRKLVYDRRIDYPAIVCLCGDSTNTQHKVMLNGPKAVRGLDFETTVIRLTRPSAR